MALGGKSIRHQGGCQVGRAIYVHHVVFIGRVRSHVKHHLLLDLKDVSVEVRIRVLIVSCIVEVAVAGQVIDECRDCASLLKVRRELHSICAVKEHSVVPGGVLVVLDLGQRCVLLASDENVFLSKPLAVCSCLLVVILTSEEGNGVVLRVGWGIV